MGGNRGIHDRGYGLVGREDRRTVGPELNVGRVTCGNVKLEFGRTTNLGGSSSHDAQRRDEGNAESESTGCANWSRRA